MARGADPLIGRVLDHRYRVDAKIARGGMATVYQAHDLRLDRGCAVKVMHADLDSGPEAADFATRFVREAHSAARLSHPNVVAVTDQGEDAGRLFLVMEHVRGRTLREVIRAEAPLPPARALALLEPVLLALAEAHRCGIVHRDIKPENVLISDQDPADPGIVKVADFGLARVCDPDAHGTQHTVTSGVLLGTVSYLAPELITTGAADPRSDVYAAGVLLFEMLTGRKPHVGEGAVQVAFKHVNEDVPPPSGLLAEPLPDYLDALVLRATARRREMRPADAKVLLHQVRRVRGAVEAGAAADEDLTMDLLPVPPRDAVTPDDLDTADDLAPLPSPSPPPPPSPASPPPSSSNVVSDDEATTVIAARSSDGGLEAVGPHVEPVLDPDHTGPAPPAEPVPVGATTMREHDPASPRRPASPADSGGWGVPAAALPAMRGSVTTDPGGSGGFGPRPGDAGRAGGHGGQAGGHGGQAGGHGGQAGGHGARGYGGSPPAGHPRAGGLGGPDTARSRSARSGARLRPRGGLVLLLVVLLVTGLVGYTGWWFGIGRYTSTPGVINLSLSDATEKAGAAGLELEVVGREFSETVTAGSVISTDPAAGARILEGGTVQALVSRGPERFSVPRLTGRPFTEISDLLESRNLALGEVERSWSGKVDEGLVISHAPGPGTDLRRDSAVNVVVSKGPKPIKIPDLAGKPAGRAENRLTDLGFDVASTEEHDDDVPRGRVISQSPSRGTGFRGDTVTLVVSKGPELIEVPDVRAENSEDARQQLSAAGFAVEIVRTDLYVGLDRVVRQSPGGEDVVPRGSTVTLYIV